MKVRLESVDGQVKRNMNIFTVDSMTGNLQVVDGNEKSDKWDHLKDIKIPEISGNTHVDMIIGRDQAHLHISLREIYAQMGEPIARLTPLRWSCIGPV